MLTKEKVIMSLESMPDNFTIDDLIDDLMVINKIEKGLEDVEKGNV
jgi:hypothetical protein